MTCDHFVSPVSLPTLLTLLQQQRPRIIRLVDAVAKAGNTLLGRQLVEKRLLGVAGSAMAVSMVMTS